MINDELLRKAYLTGSELAYTSDLEKVAFLGGAINVGKFLMGMGHLGAKGSRLARISPHHIGQPLGFGVIGAATAEEGQGMEGFVKGVAGGLAFNAAMPIGGFLGKRLLGGAFKGKGTSAIMKRMGFADGAVANMAASQKLNKALHGSFLRSPITRKLDAGLASNAQIKALRKNFTSTLKPLKGLDKDLKAQRTALSKLFRQKNLSPAQQAELKKLYSQFSKSLYKSGYGTGTLGQRAALSGLRFSKGLGSVAGGMGLGAYLTHGVESAMDTQPASVFDARGGH